MNMVLRRFSPLLLLVFSFHLDLTSSLAREITPRVIFSPSVDRFGFATTSIRRYDVNSGGDVAFEVGPGVIANPFLHILAFSASGSSVAQQILRGAPSLPGTDGNLSGFDRFFLSDDGDLTFYATLETPAPGITSGNNNGLWQYTGSGIDLVVLEGDIAPETNGALFGYDFPSLARFGLMQRSFMPNADGELIFRGDIRHDAVLGVDFDNDTGIWRTTPNGLDLLAREADIAPSTGGRPFRSFGYPAFNDIEQSVFFASLVGPFETDQTFYQYSPGEPELNLIARSGFPAPGTNGALFDFRTKSSDLPTLNSSGEFAFVGGLQLGGAITQANRYGVWKGSDQGLELVAQTGTPAPGLDNIPFDFFHDVLMNDAGDMLLKARVLQADGSRVEGLWGSTDSGFELIAVKGQQAPGTGGQVFDRIDHASINEHGDFVFYAEMPRNPREQFVTAGLWSYPAGGGGLSLVSLTGDQIVLPDGRSETVIAYDVSKAYDVLEFSEYLSDSRELFVTLHFTDGVNSFTGSALVAFQIPEPTSSLLAVVGVLGMLTLTRRQRS